MAAGLVLWRFILIFVFQNASPAFGAELKARRFPVSAFGPEFNLPQGKAFMMEIKNASAPLVHISTGDTEAVIFGLPQLPGTAVAYPQSTRIAMSVLLRWRARTPAIAGLAR